VEIRDDGRGFDAEKAREFLKNGRVGLASMRERATAIGGRLEITSAPGRGTAVRLTVP
jgi:signal transduction histidine kinase